MTRSVGLCMAFGSLLILGLANAQPPTSDLYKQSLQQGGLPYRVGDGFYIPEGCSWTVDYYGQCGGSGAPCNPATGICLDAQYPGACCPGGFECQRQNPQYWQCVQSAPSYEMSAAGNYPLGPFEQCGGVPPANTSFVAGGNGQFLNASCPDGFMCSPQSATFFLCSPNPQFTARKAESPYLSILQYIGDLVTRLTGATALAPGLAQYNFIFPGIDGVSAEKPVSVTLNVSRITGIIDSLIGGKGPATAPPPSPVVPPSPFPPPVTPPSPSGIPPGPAPQPPPPAFNFTVPRINFQPPPPISIDGTKIVDSNGTEVTFNGFNWFGFEVGATMVDGLYQNNLNPRNFSQVGDFATIVYRQQALGFNAVRLPFRFGDLNIAPPKDYTRPCSADSQAQIIGNLTNPTIPYYQIDYATQAANFPPQRAPILPPQDVASSGLCNSYLPNDTTLNRFLWVIQFFIGNGFYVAIDYHGGQGFIESDRQIVSNPSIFQSNWLGLLTAIQSLPTWQNGTLPGRLILDPLNEPDGWYLAWNQTNVNPRGLNANSSTVPSWGSLYTDTAAALIQQEPRLLFFAEGTGQANQSGTAFGMGFGINPAIYNGQPGLYNALGGLQLILNNADVKARTVISPHAYGFQITGWTIGNTNSRGLGLPFTYYNNFAYLTSIGVPDYSGINQTFPIAIGEFGNVFNSSFNATENNFSDPLSDEWIRDFAFYSNLLDPVNATLYPHTGFNSSFWWDWNANSFPQLGLVNADPGDVQSYDPNGPLNPGWLNIQWIKINNLTDVLNNNPFFTPAEAVASGGGWGLRPWYLQ